MTNTKTNNHILIGIIGGIIVGFINGFFGGGGGMIVVPLLTLLLKLNEKIAHATAIFIILPLSIVSSIVYISNQSVDWFALIYSSIGFIIGGILGALILKKINNRVLTIIFSLIMIVVGVKMLI